MSKTDAADLGRCPAWLEPLAEDRALVERVLERLDVATDLTERADLAGELVRAASRYEDTLERAILPKVPDHPAAALEPDRAQLRDAMTIVHHRTMHTDPRNVYASDPQGFEDALNEIRDLLPTLMAAEDHLFSQIEQTLSGDEAAGLRHEVEHAYRHASERPQPPRTAVGRLIANANVKLDRAFEDVASPRHPGADTIRGSASE